MEKVADKALVFLLLLAIVGAAFKLMHLQGGNYMLICGLSGVAFASFIKYASQKTLDGYLFGSSIFLGCIGMLFKIMHWPNGTTMIYAAVVCGIIWGIRSFRNKDAEGGTQE